MSTVELPPKRPGGARVVLTDVRSIVIVGANGTGKTRLGAQIEQTAGAKAQRISAQRVLVIPASVQPRAHEHAEMKLQFGLHQPSWTPAQYTANKLSHRWGNEPYTYMLNDFEDVLAMLFADEAKRSRDYTRSALKVLPKEQPPKCKLDLLAGIWKAVMPQRSLTVFDDKIEAGTVTGERYEVYRHG